MLKWAVGQKIPSSTSSTCSEIIPSVVCCSSACRQNTLKAHSVRPTSVRTAYVRNLKKAAGKENRRKCRKSSERKMVKSASASARNKDSIYMQLDSIPAALRDVSNHWSPGCENVPDREARTLRRRRLKKSPCNANSHKNVVEFLPGNSNEDDKEVCRKPDASNVTLTEASKEPHFERKKQPCSGEHHLAAYTVDPANKTSMLVDNPLYFTIQTSPPEEPDELFHKELPVKRCKQSVLGSCDNLNLNRNIRLPLIDDNNRICDIDGNPCEVTTLTKNLSWLKLNNRNRHELTRLQLFNVSSSAGDEADLEKSRTSSLDIMNPNSAVLSDTNVSDASLATDSSKFSLKRKRLMDNADADLSTKKTDTIEKIKSKRRCVVFNEQSFPLNTPPPSDHSQPSSGVASIDLDQPSVLKRQKVIRRKNRRRNLGTVPPTIYNKNLKSWLTLPNGIPSPFEVNEKQFKVFDGTPLAHNVTNTLCEDEPDEFSIMKKAMSTPKPDCLFNLTKDVFLSPGVRPLLESVIQTSSDNDVASLKPKGEEETSYVSPVSEETWNSHGKHLAQTVTVVENDGNSSLLDTSQSSCNSRINDDQDVFSSMVSSTPTLASSPTAQPRSRRCLSFVSPTSAKMQTKHGRTETGQLDLRIYYSNGLLTVHIIRARNLQKIVGELPCNAYVKVNLVPQMYSKTFHRTCVRKNSFNPKFDHKFSMEISENDLTKRVLISAWHRDRGKQKSEFLGCMSFAIKNILKKEINGSYKLLSQNSNKSYASQFQQSQDLMAGQTTYTVEDRANVETDRLHTPGGNEKLRSMTVTRKEMNKVHEEYLFLQHLELDPVGSNQSDTKKSGRTPFTTTHKLVRQSGSSYGFSIAWTHPPRVERVEANLPADNAGLKPGDNVIFVNKTNVVTLSEEKILDIIKSCGNQLVLEIYRKPVANGTIGNNIQKSNQLPSRRLSKALQSDSSTNESRSTTAYSTATAPSTEVSKKRMQLPQITFSSEEKVEESENSRQHFVYQLLKKEQQYALCLQFGISRFFLPLAERRDVIRPNEHQLLFQNVQELLRITEDLIERTTLEEGESFGKSIGKIYLKKFPAINSAYRRYCCGLKKADCILVEKTRCGEFMRLVTDPPIPKKRPDLVSFIHKPLQHFRDVLKILQLIANCKESKEMDHHILTKLITELQATYRNITVESGLMDCGAEGRPILSLQDLESRLVFTRCKPFTLNTQGRKWIFAGDLSRIEGKTTRILWALLFSDILLFTKINRDRVVFVTEEPLPLAMVAETQFNIKKKDTEFRLIIGLGGRRMNFDVSSSSGTNSPAQQGCVPMMHFHSPLAKRTPQNKDLRRRIFVFRAPSPELKAVWQNLIQRQVIKINTTGQGITPATSPMDSPNQLTTDSAATTDTSSTVYKRQCDGVIDDFIERKCKQFSKQTTKGKAFHLAKWMKGELNDGNTQSWSEPEIETWSDEMLKQHTQNLDINLNIDDNHIVITNIDMTDGYSESVSASREKSPKRTPGEILPLCQKCHETCLQASSQCGKTEEDLSENIYDAFLDHKWKNSPVPPLLSPVEPFNPVPGITTTPPDTPQPELWTVSNIDDVTKMGNGKVTKIQETNEEYEGDENGDTNSSDYYPYKSLQNHSTSLKRYSSMYNLNKLIDDEVEKNESEDITNERPADKQSFAMSWANKASHFVAQKVALFEKIGENVQNSSFLETFRYLRPSQDVELASTSQTLAFEEDCENSAGTSGDEFWGTPNSGGASVASNECAPLSPTSSHEDDDDDSEEKIIEEMLLNRTTAMLAQQHSMTPSRMLQNKSRLEPLPEAEEENITKSSFSSLSSQDTSLSVSDCTMSCPVPQTTEANSILGNSHSSYIGQSSTVFGRMKLRRCQSVDESSSEITEGDTETSKNIHRKKKSKLLRFFSRHVDDDKMEKSEGRFWRKLRRRQTN